MQRDIFMTAISYLKYRVFLHYFLHLYLNAMIVLQTFLYCNIKNTLLQQWN